MAGFWPNQQGGPAMDDPIRIEKVPAYPPKIRENGKSEKEGEKKRKKTNDEEDRKGPAESIDGHIDTVA
jgi:hypothetical protein